MKEILIYGHKNPDSDAICTSIAYSNLKNQLGANTRAIRIGKLNEETKYVLDYFEVEDIEYVENVAGKDIILIDHNERTQTADGFEEARVIELIDHHKISNFNVSEPLFARVEPVGCTSTIVYNMYKENGIKPCKKMAGLMLSAIISDTLLFNSPTCTDKDKEAVYELAKIAKVDINKYGLDMLKAGANLASKTDNEILNMDMKIFDMNSKKIAIAQVNSFNVQEMLDKKEGLKSEMLQAINNNGIDTYLFVITDVLKNDSIGIAVGNELNKIEQAFNSKINNDIIELKGIVSRKKQLVPPLIKIF